MARKSRRFRHRRGVKKTKRRTRYLKEKLCVEKPKKEEKQEKKEVEKN